MENILAFVCCQIFFEHAISEMQTATIIFTRVYLLSSKRAEKKETRLNGKGGGNERLFVNSSKASCVSFALQE